MLYYIKGIAIILCAAGCILAAEKKSTRWAIAAIIAGEACNLICIW